MRFTGERDGDFVDVCTDVGGGVAGIVAAVTHHEAMVRWAMIRITSQRLTRT